MMKVGDLVRHRASGERAVVSEVIMHCDNPEHVRLGPVGHIADGFGNLKKDCTSVLWGYKVSFGLDRQATVRPHHIEPVEGV